MPEKANHLTLWERTCCMGGSGVLIFEKFPSPGTRTGRVSQAIEVFQIVVNIIALSPRKFSRRYYRGSTYIDCLSPARQPKTRELYSLKAYSHEAYRFPGIQRGTSRGYLPDVSSSSDANFSRVQPPGPSRPAPLCPNPPTPLNSFIVFHGKFGNESRRAAPNDTTQFSRAHGSRCSYRQIHDTKNQAPLNFFDTNYEVEAAPRVGERPFRSSNLQSTGSQSELSILSRYTVYGN